MRPILLLPLIVFLFVLRIVAQTIPPSRTTTSDPQAIALASQAARTLTGGTQVASAVLTGTTTRIIGPDQQKGSVTLKAQGIGESRIDLALSSTFSEVRDDGLGQGFWYGKDQTWHAMAFHNCQTDAAWFFPALSASLLGVSSPSTTASYIGQETREGITVQHIRISRQASSANTGFASLLWHLSTVDFYLDAQSLLPDFIAFAAHPDNDAGTDIPAEIRLADYRNVSGVQVPFRVQKLVQGSLFLDIVVSQAAINTGISDSDFVVSQGGVRP
ncbi:MAG TPA: hypothetical protein VMT56_04425 [Candidatus Bathyarchaeia archaeon]|nr:hypothetical protein [Candidatus Bathyarchaeia archaeon]